MANLPTTGNFGGSAVQLKYRGVRFANAVDVSFNETYSILDAEVLGELDPVEHVVDGRRRRGRLRMLRLSKKSLVALGVMQGGKNPGKFLVFDKGNFQIVKTTDDGEETIWNMSKVIIETRDWRAAKGMLSITEAGFRFIDLDEE